ncbi:septum formation family protein [Cellulomonas wangsupingiae]|uniref:Septum formation family protein n=1 Tax=Cellulomonas wangsupingiae TaxID=2968085 RepID=A0ABY5K484_9CELL|nr:septum formation family protein [Cellulomonas wangsupingiae]MCC2336186.1 septum formation family protein [Cellulomonas wangsupingiae]MCM0641566.1 septum formation family protein [Cellulomonas wangsupingiae]UUI64569.1 septum formation family protein [Cellulomonas wangsupingiae]
MNPTPRRLLSVSAVAVALAATLTGCGSVLDSVLGDQPEAAQRDEPGGEITASAEADVFSLQVGDCLNYLALSEESTEFSSLPTVPCAEQHDAEIYAETNLTKEQYEADLALADDTETPTHADQFCYDAFSGFVGTSYEESTLDYTYLSPTPEGWAGGDDVVQCLVLHLEGGLTGSMQGTGL